MFENVAGKMAAILSLPQCVYPLKCLMLHGPQAKVACNRHQQSIGIILAFHIWATVVSICLLMPGPRCNIKMLSYQYRKSHCGDMTIL